MNNFWDYNVWGNLLLISVLLLAVITANTLKRAVSILRDSLIPASVLGGIILLLISFAYKLITGNEMFDTALFNGNGISDALVFGL